MLSTNSEIKIPTLFGLGLLVVGLIGGVWLVTQSKTGMWQTKASTTATPKNIALVNLADTSATVMWQTDEETTGFIQAGVSGSLDLTFRDERDLKIPQPHRLHFVTLTNLAPNTVYYYKLSSPPSLYPKDPLSFRTLAPLSPSSSQPVIGTVLDADLPVSEAFVSLEIPGVYKTAAITKLGGSFILPTTQLRSSTTEEIFDINKTQAKTTLTVFNLDKSSRVNLTLPLSQNQLPPIRLGQDLDFGQTQASPAADLTASDLNSDGVINSVDSSIVLKNFGKDKIFKGADLNHDGVVDEKDLQIINQFTLKTFPSPSPGLKE